MATDLLPADPTQSSRSATDIDDGDRVVGTFSPSCDNFIIEPAPRMRS